jgi:hypothetical protein
MIESISTSVESVLPEKPEPSATIWHYMSLENLLSLVIDKELYFNRLDRLEDPYEGASPLRAYEQMRSWLQEAIASSDESEKYDASEIVLDTVEEEYRGIRRSWYVSCWHEADGESMAMWKIYAARGVAIVTTCGLLESSLPPVQLRQHDVVIGRVQYREWDRDPSDLIGFLDNVYTKGPAYSYEKEVRASVMNFRLACHDLRDRRVIGPAHDNPPGLKIPVDVDRLIERVVVSPLHSKRIALLVQAVIQKFGCNTPVVSSELLSTPGWVPVA